MNASSLQLADYLLPVRSISPTATFGDSDFTYVDISAVDRERRSIINPQIIATSDAPSRARQKLAQGDVIVSTVRPNLNTVAMVTEEYAEAVASTGFCVLRPDPERLDARYLFHWVSSESTVAKLVSLATGATYPAVSDKTIKSLHPSLPPIREQKRIAAILDKADGLRRRRQESFDLTDDFLRAVFLEMFGDPEANPYGFRLGKVRELVASANYGTAEKASEESGEFPILRMNNITSKGSWNFASLKYVDLSPKVREKFLARKGDVLFNRTNSVELVGKTAVFEEEASMAIAGYLVRVRTNEIGDPYYLAGYLNSAHGKATLKAMAKSIVGMANINAQEMQEIPILIPPVGLQRRYGRLVQVVRAHQKTQTESLAEITALASVLSTKHLAVA